MCRSLCSDTFFLYLEFSGRNSKKTPCRYQKLLLQNTLPKFCSAMQYLAIPGITMQHHAMPWNTIQYHAYHAIPCNRAYHCPVGSIRQFFTFNQPSFFSIISITKKVCFKIFSPNISLNLLLSGKRWTISGYKRFSRRCAHLFSFPFSIGPKSDHWSPLSVNH